MTRGLRSAWDGEHRWALRIPRTAGHTCHHPHPPRVRAPRASTSAAAVPQEVCAQSTTFDQRRQPEHSACVGLLLPPHTGISQPGSTERNCRGRGTRPLVLRESSSASRRRGRCPPASRALRDVDLGFLARPDASLPLADPCPVDARAQTAPPGRGLDLGYELAHGHPVEAGRSLRQLHPITERIRAVTVARERDRHGTPSNRSTPSNSYAHSRLVALQAARLRPDGRGGRHGVRPLITQTG